MHFICIKYVFCRLASSLYHLFPKWQAGEETFNRAKLLNIGYAEALKEYDYDCFVFSDVDLIPMDDRNFYKCYNQPRHLSVSMDKFGFRYFCLFVDCCLMSCFNSVFSAPRMFQYVFIIIWITNALTYVIVT